MSFAEYVSAYALASSGKRVPPEMVIDVLAALPPPEISYDQWQSARAALIELATSQTEAKPELTENEAEAFISESCLAMIEKAKGGNAVEAGILTVERIPDGG